MKIIIITILAASLGGCAHSYGTFPPGQAEAPAMDRLCIMTAKDGVYGGTVYVGSGQEVSGKMLSTIRGGRLGQSIQVPATDETEAARQCAAEGVGYLIVPRILHWEDRATQWSGLRDEIAVEARLLRLEPRETVRIGNFSAQTGSFALFNHPPEDLLNDEYSLWVKKLVGLPVPANSK
jgi:hypothetical protein